MKEQKIAVITDTGTDTPADFAAAHDVRTVALAINYSNGDSFRSGFEITSSEVVDRFAEEIPTTSLPSPSDIRSTLEAVRADGYEAAVFVTISSGLSATNHTAHLVASQMPDFPVTIIDTKSVGIAAGPVVMGAVRMVEEGVPYEELGPLPQGPRQRNLWVLYGSGAFLPTPRRPYQRGYLSLGQHPQPQTSIYL